VEVKKIGVLGAGIMGAGIAQICAEAGFEVILVDLAEAFVNKGYQNIVKNWTRAVEKGKRSAEELDENAGNDDLFNMYTRIREAGNISPHLPDS
jgi:3-hydroxybutyryl-CoA dehydrogenase